MIYELMVTESTRLQDKLLSLETQLQTYPDGTLLCFKNGKYSKWYHSLNHSKHYLSKKRRFLAEQLATKKYLSCLYQETLHEKRAIDLYLKHHSQKVSQSSELIAPGSEYRELLAPYFSIESEEFSNWMHMPYEQNPNYPEHLIIPTSSGHLVRSKSEALIATALYVKKIPFRYECRLKLGVHTLYPDFTLRHPHTGKYYYWEHFGLMDDTSYSQNAYSKLQLYTSHNILPSLQLITTFETKEHPLSPELIDKTIDFYFK